MIEFRVTDIDDRIQYMVAVTREDNGHMNLVNLTTGYIDSVDLIDNNHLFNYMNLLMTTGRIKSFEAVKNHKVSEITSTEYDKVMSHVKTQTYRTNSDGTITGRLELDNGKVYQGRDYTEELLRISLVKRLSRRTIL